MACPVRILRLPPLRRHFARLHSLSKKILTFTWEPYYQDYWKIPNSRLILSWLVLMTLLFKMMKKKLLESHSNWRVLKASKRFPWIQALWRAKLQHSSCFTKSLTTWGRVLLPTVRLFSPLCSKICLINFLRLLENSPWKLVSTFWMQSRSQLMLLCSRMPYIPPLSIRFKNQWKAMI